VREATVYWRPGCPSCVRLRWGLRLTGTPHRLVNIREDPAAAALVREHNSGDELVPTVVAGGRVLSNPSVRLVRRSLEQAG
jgi:glutaredoxin